MHKLNETPLHDFEFAQIECLIYIAGYVVFSYFKKSSGCLSCHNFLTTNKPLEVNNEVGSQYTLIDLADRGSLKYPSHSVVECLFIFYETFLKIDNRDLSKKNLFWTSPKLAATPIYVHCGREIS